jgi:hypothetical protein
MSKYKKPTVNLKPVMLVNPLNSDVWMCSDYSNTKDIDGVVYLTVYRPENSNRTFLMRKDALKLSSKGF